MTLDPRMFPEDARVAIVHGVYGRDAGKTFHVYEIDPLTFSGFVLRLLAALKVDSYEALLDEFRPAVESDKGVPIDAIMRVLQGCDPKAVHQLIHEMLDYVFITPDPQHPAVVRALLPNEIRELKTLGEILRAVVTINFAA